MLRSLLLLAALASAQQTPGHKVVAIRLPTWDIAVITTFQGLVRAVTPLLPQEIEEAKKIFGDAIDYSVVRVGVATDNLIDFPTTWANLIRLPPGMGFPKSTMIHELVHIWQYQTGGSAYISDSFLHQSASFLKTGKREGAYDYRLVEGKRLIDYEAEQQAQIVEDYSTSLEKRLDPRYQALIAQLKGHKAIRGIETVLMERDAGLQPRRFVMPSILDDQPGPKIIPQLELRFDLP